MFISKAIAMFTGSSYTHVGIISSIHKDYIMVAEALAEGFTLVKYPIEKVEYLLSNDMIYIKQAKISLDEKKVRQAIINYLGRPYGYLDLVMILISIISGRRIFKGTAKKLICSEAVTRVLYDASEEKINFETEYEKAYSYITPDDIFMSKQLKSL